MFVSTIKYTHSNQSPLVRLVVSNGKFDLLAFGEVEKRGILTDVDDLLLGGANQLHSRLDALEFDQSC